MSSIEVPQNQTDEVTDRLEGAGCCRYRRVGYPGLLLLLSWLDTKVSSR